MLFNFMKSNQKSSSNLAKARLRNILITDRLKVSPEIADQIKVKILESLNQYVEIDDEGVILELNNNSGTVTLSTTVPIKQLKKR
ncbi:cell division topological specificity factor MinE [Clostridium sp. 'deep sea']|nr:cell division topological specificity factor MinE [Clostridium sp. 'deep sea']